MALVSQLFRYPVKSLQGERVERLEFTNGSAAGDRQWALVDSLSGVFLSAKRHGRLLDASASTTSDGSVVIALPSGKELEAADPATAAALSDWLGHDVELRRPADGVMPAYEALADSTDESSDTVTFAGPSTHFADFADVHVMTTASLRAAKGLHPQGDWDVRRFRPTMVLEAEGEGFVEDEWVGSRLGVGATASFQLFMKTIRCNLPTRAQPGLGRDTFVARVLRDEHDFCLGVYGAFRQGGLVAVGDTVSLVSD
ncbi:MAG: MOSC N-terminal beta barrel domain-containing protein [Acidimicrobiales bacterium]|jgi:uncharacterized protein YcbX